MLVQLLRKNMTERNALSDALDVMSADEVRALVRRGSSPSVDSDVSSTVVDTYESSGSLPTADVTPGEEMAILLTSMLTPRASDAMVGDARPQLRTMLLNVTATVISTPAANDLRIGASPSQLTTRPFAALSSADKDMLPNRLTHDAAVRLDRERLRQRTQRIVNVTYVALTDPGQELSEDFTSSESFEFLLDLKMRTRRVMDEMALHAQGYYSLVGKLMTLANLTTGKASSVVTVQTIPLANATNVANSSVNFVEGDTLILMDFNVRRSDDRFTEMANEMFMEVEAMSSALASAQEVVLAVDVELNRVLESPSLSVDDIHLNISHYPIPELTCIFNEFVYFLQHEVEGVVSSE